MGQSHLLSAYRHHCHLTSWGGGEQRGNKANARQIIQDNSFFPEKGKGGGGGGGGAKGKIYKERYIEGTENNLSVYITMGMKGSRRLAV